ncbi:MAG: topoisomerase DNA-binding C4 zinc finger domain-containing protein [Candidatus Lokiarchaeota archaeon]
MNAVNGRGNQGTYKLENIALEVGIKPKDVLRVLADLRDRGKIQYKFNPDTGEIELGQSIRYVKAEEYQETPKQKVNPVTGEERNFCPYCGQKLETKANFCPNCGSKLVERTARRVKNAGSKFLGCSSFPKCKFTKNI